MLETPDQRIAQIDVTTLGKHLRVDEEVTRDWIHKLNDQMIDIYGLVNSDEDAWRGAWYAFRQMHVFMMTYVHKHPEFLKKLNDEERDKIMTTPTDEIIQRFTVMLQGYLYLSAKHVAGDNSDQD